MVHLERKVPRVRSVQLEPLVIAACRETLDQREERERVETWVQLDQLASLEHLVLRVQMGNLVSQD